MNLVTAAGAHACLHIRPVSVDQLGDAVEVYRQCEDFLALGPVPSATMQMVRDDMLSSAREGGTFCAVWTEDERMAGVVDYVPCGSGSDPKVACLRLLMIAAPFRRQGVGTAVLKVVEDEIWKNSEVTTILSGVQVNNPLAIQFWLRNGYRLAGGPELMPDRTTVYHLRKDLAQR